MITVVRQSGYSSLVGRHNLNSNLDQPIWITCRVESDQKSRDHSSHIRVLIPCNLIDPVICYLERRLTSSIGLEDV